MGLYYSIKHIRNMIKGVVGRRKGFRVKCIRFFLPQKHKNWKDHRKLNNVEPSINFTNEKEFNNTIPFLDILIIKSHNILTFKVYHKQKWWHTYIFILWLSATYTYISLLLYYKYGWLATFLTRWLCTPHETLNKELLMLIIFFRDFFVLFF